MPKSLTPGFWRPCVPIQTGQAKNVGCCSRSTFQGPFRRWITLPSQQQPLFRAVNRNWSSNISICYPRLHGAFSKQSLSKKSRVWTLFFPCHLSFCFFLIPLYTKHVSGGIFEARTKVLLSVLCLFMLNIKHGGDFCVCTAVTYLTKVWLGLFRGNYKWTGVMWVNVDVYVLIWRIVPSMKW